MSARAGEGARRGAAKAPGGRRGYLVSSGAVGVNEGPRAEPGLGLRVLLNPSGEHTALRFELGHSRSVVVAIFDVHGRRVRVLHSGLLHEGEHALSWDGRDQGGQPVPDGLYFARVEGNGSTATKQVARMR